MEAFWASLVKVLADLVYRAARRYSLITFLNKYKLDVASSSTTKFGLSILFSAVFVQLHLKEKKIFFLH